MCKVKGKNQAQKIRMLEAKLAKVMEAVESYRGTHLVSASGTHLGDPAEKILAAAKEE